jgi:hypothetical protein
MLKLFARPRRVASQATYTLRSVVRVHNQEIHQTQLATEHYVITRLERGLLLFWAERGERFEVDTAQRRLRPLDLSAQQAQIERLRPLVGRIRITRGEGEERVEGFACHHYSIHNESAQIVLAGEAYVTRVPGLERTALAADRELDARGQLLSLPLAADEVMVLSTSKTLSQGFEQSQSHRLLSVEPSIEELERFDEVLSYRVAG